MFGAKTRAVQNLIQDPAWASWASGLGDGPLTGSKVTATSATQLLTVYGCVTRIADVMGTMPVDHYTRLGGIQTEVAQRAGWLDRANVDQDWSTFVIQTVWSLLIDGNAFIVPVRNPAGRVLEVWLLDPTTVHLDRRVAGAPVSVFVNGHPYLGELLHIPAYVRPGEVRGMNPIDNARVALGLGMSAQEYGKGFFDNSGIPAVVIKAKGTLTSSQKKDLREGWGNTHGGPSKSGGLGIIDGDGDITQLTVAPEQAQFLDTQRFSAAQIATNLFHVPPDMVGVALDGNTITYQNMETRWTEFVRSACQRWMTSIERAVSYQFLPRPQFIKFVPDVYLRADTQSRYQTQKVGIDAGFLTDDEARAMENLPPLTDAQREQIKAMRKPVPAPAATP